MREPTRNVFTSHATQWSLAAALCVLGSVPLSAVAADPEKILRVALSSSEMSFDPQFSADAGSDAVIDHIYESMLDYDYLARPVKLVPRTLDAMPTVEDGGATYVFKLKRGIFFTPGPAFKGKPRELVVGDQVRRRRDRQYNKLWPSEDRGTMPQHLSPSSREKNDLAR